MARIYISSTYRDLRRERLAAKDAVVRAKHLPIGMETDAGGERPPVETCLENVRSCQGYVGIFAWRYGSLPPGQSASFTELEYEEAGRHGIPRLIFLLHEEAVWPQESAEKDPRVLALRARLDRDHTTRRFSSPESLTIEVLTTLAATFKAGRPIPDLLPYLADRSAQEEELEEAIVREDGQNARRSLVCVIHGDDRQSHETFLDRLTEISLPRMLGLDAQRTRITRYNLEWPQGCRGLDHLGRRLRASLGRKVLNRPAELAEVQRALAANPGPVAIHTRVLAEDCRPVEVLRAFLNLWQGWPDLAAGQRLFALLSVKYQTKSALGLIQRWLARGLNERLADFVETLDFSGYDRLAGVVLPRLEGVPRAEVENWADHHAASFCRDDRLLADVRQLFERWEANTSSRVIPMESLAAELRSILYAYNT